MHLIQLQQFFAMGGYAKYVWSAYGLTFIVLLANVVSTCLNHRYLFIQLKQKNANIINATHTNSWQQSKSSISNNANIFTNNMRIE